MVMAKKKIETVSDILKRDKDEIPVYLPQELLDRVPDIVEKSNSEIVAIALTYAAHTGDMSAIKEYLDRTEGKVKEVMVVDDIGKFVPNQKEVAEEKIRQWKKQKRAEKKAEAQLQ